MKLGSPGVCPGLAGALRPVTVVAGHYGAGKTNFSVNVAVDLSKRGVAVTLIDLDIVNPYFRATEQRALLEEHGIALIAPVFSEAGTSLDVPSLTGRITPAINDAADDGIVIIDVGGDDVGATALGRFARAVAARDYAMLYVANRFRNLVQDPADALENIREIEAASHLKATAIVNNSHLKQETTADDLLLGKEYARALSGLSGLPVACTTVPEHIAIPKADDLYPVRSYVTCIWD